MLLSTNLKYSIRSVKTRLTEFRLKAFQPVMDDGYIELIIPNKPIDSKQYRLIQKGINAIS